LDLQTLINLGAVIGMPVLGWLVKAQSDLRKDLTGFQIKAAETYVTHDDLKDIKQLLERIDDKLDGKADKARP
jgi:hypothetical protein